MNFGRVIKIEYVLNTCSILKYNQGEMITNLFFFFFFKRGMELQDINN